jgi:hypothetical protein
MIARGPKTMFAMPDALLPQRRDNASELLPENPLPRIMVISVGEMGSRMLQPLLHAPIAGVTRLRRYQDGWRNYLHPVFHWPSLKGSRIPGLKPGARPLHMYRMPPTLKGISAIAENAKACDCLTIAPVSPVSPHLLCRLLARPGELYAGSSVSARGGPGLQQACRHCNRNKENIDARCDV